MKRLEDPLLERKAQMIARVKFNAYKTNFKSKSPEEDVEKLKQFINEAREFVSK